LPEAYRAPGCRPIRQTLDDLDFEHEPGCTPADGGANRLRLTICYPDFHSTV
jgi:hypothetical protein